MPFSVTCSVRWPVASAGCLPFWSFGHNFFCLTARVGSFAMYPLLIGLRPQSGTKSCRTQGESVRLYVFTCLRSPPEASPSPCLCQLLGGLLRTSSPFGAEALLTQKATLDESVSGARVPEPISYLWAPGYSRWADNIPSHCENDSFNSWKKFPFP